MVSLRKVAWAGLLVVLLLALSASAALAQGGGGDKVVLGGSYTLAQGQTLNGRLIVLGGNAALEPESTVAGDVTVMGGTLNAAGYIRGDVAVFGGTISLADTAVVDGNLNSWGGSIHRAGGAVVKGATQQGPVTPRPFTAPNVPDGPARVAGVQALPPRPATFFLQLIGRFFGALGLGLLLVVIAIVVVVVAPKHTAQVANAMAGQPAIAFAVGLLTLVLATLIGFPLLVLCGLGLLVWLLTLVALLFGWVAAGVWLGQRIMSALRVRASSSLSEVALGVFLITWITWVSPRCIGWLIGIIVGCIGLGAVLLTRFGTQPGGWSSNVAPDGPTSGLLTAASTTFAGPADPPVTPAGDREQPAAPEPGVPAGSGQPAVGPAGEMGSAAELAGWQHAAARASTPGEELLPPASLGDAAQAGRPAPAVTEGPARPYAKALDDLEAVIGITPDVAGRLRASGITTLLALAIADPESLAATTGVAAERIRADDWMGQARRLLG